MPFNAIVLGVEQLAAELQPHGALLPDAADTIAILSEQSQSGGGGEGREGTGWAAPGGRAHWADGLTAAVAVAH